MKKFIAYFIKYPVAVNVMLIGIIFFGWAGASRLKSSFFPLTPSNIITVTVAYPGASPQEIEEGVVLKIEDNLRGLVGIDQITSTSLENAATITVEAFQNYDVDVILANVKNAVDRVPNFPVGMEPPVIAKQEILNEAISFNVSGKDVPLRTLKQIAESIEDDLRRMEDISQVTLSGFPAQEIEIAVREQDLRAYDLTFTEVARAVSNANILTTGGNIKTDEEEYLIRAKNRAYYGDELDFIVVRATASGQVIRLRDVATVTDRWAESPDRLYFNGEPSIQVRVQTTNNEDLITASEKVVEYINAYNLSHDNIRIDIGRDASIALKQRTELLVNNGLLGILLVLILLSLFLKPSLAFWVAFGLPISFFGMFIFSPSFMTINVMSLFGMIIVIGILVDDGIVIGENIYHHYEKGKSPIRAAIDGTLEVAPPIVSAILTTMVAFSTFFFLQGTRLGNFYTEVSIVVLLTLGFSLLEALVILPAHISHSRAMKKNKQSYLLNRYADNFMLAFREKIYSPALRFLLTYKLLGISIPIALLIITMGAISSGVIGVTFFPAIASDRVSITLEMPKGTSEHITDSLISKIEVAAWEVNEEFTEQQTGKQQVIQNIIRRIGPGTSTSSLQLNLLPGETRDAPSSDIANAVQERVGPIYGVESLIYGSGSNFGGSPVSVSLVGSNIVELKRAKEALKVALREIPELKDVSDNDPAGIKEVILVLKENAYLMGLTLNDVMSQVRSGFFGQSVQRFQRGRDEIRVWVRYDRKDRKSIKSLDDMWIVTPTRNRVPLSEIATYTIARGEVAINHLDGVREIKVTADVKKRGESTTEILTFIQDDIMPEILAQNPSVSPQYSGQNREAGKISKALGIALPGVLIAIVLIIAFTFRSYSQPFILFLMIPFSLIGVAWGHWLHGQPVSILSALGIVALIGIVVNDGLVLIGKFNGFLREGLKYDEALYQAGRSRFRAIFLTSITTIAGLAPLIFETSRQAQFLIPMAISIAYGIFIATFLTLFMLPLLLSFSNYIKVGIQWLFTGKMPSRESVERPVKEQLAEQEELLID